MALFPDWLVVTELSPGDLPPFLPQRKPGICTLTIADDDAVSLPAAGYSLTQLLVMSSPTWAFGINTEPDGQGGYRGQVVGQTLYLTNGVGPQGGFKWNNGNYSYFAIPPTPYYLIHSGTLAINDAATVVGFKNWYYNTYYSAACYWPAGSTTPTSLASLGAGNGLDNLASDINQRAPVNGVQRGGLIAGQSVRFDNKTHAAVWIPNPSGVYAAPLDLQDLGDGTRYSYATAINDFGEVVGRSQIGSGNNYHGFRSRSEYANDQWEPMVLSGPFDDMGTATSTDGHTSEFNDINKFQEVVGRGNAPSGQMRALYKAPFSPKDTGYFDLGVLGAGTANAGTESVANAISANGIIVGSSKVKEGGVQVWRAFVISNAGIPGSVPMADLTSLSSVYLGSGQWSTAAAQGWKLVSAERVNRAGWIVGYGTKNGVTRGFVLSPR